MNPMILLFLTLKFIKDFYKGSWLPYLLFSLNALNLSSILDHTILEHFSELHIHLCGYLIYQI